MVIVLKSMQDTRMYTVHNETHVRSLHSTTQNAHTKTARSPLLFTLSHLTPKGLN